MPDILDVNTLFGSLPMLNADLTLDGLRAMLHKHGIQSALTLSTVGILLDPEVGNAITRATCADQPDLLPVATLHPERYFGDDTPVLRLADDGFRMVRFFPDLQGWPIAFAPFQAQLAALARAARPLPIMVDVLHAGQITQLAEVAKGYPGTVVLGRVELNLLAEALLVLRQNPRWYIEISRLLACGALAQVARTAGVDRILFGSSAPLRSMGGIMNMLRVSGLSGAEQEQVLMHNAGKALLLP